MFRLHKNHLTQGQTHHIDQMISCLFFLFTPSTNFVKAQGSLRNSWARKWEDVFGCYCHCFRPSSSGLGNLTSSDYLSRCFLLVSRISHIASHRILCVPISLCAHLSTFELNFDIVCPAMRDVDLTRATWASQHGLYFHPAKDRCWRRPSSTFFHLL